MNGAVKSLRNYVRDHYGELANVFRRENRKETGLFLTPLLAALLLLLLDRFALQRYFMRHFASLPWFAGMDPNTLSFYGQLYFSTNTLLLFVLLPLLFHLLFPVGGKNPLGLRWAGATPHLPVYLLFLAVMLPLLWIVTGDPSFYRFYPMYDPVSPGMFLLYEAFYLPHFFTVEFFFRGFFLFRMERIMGYYAIPVAALPYALIHIYKPFPEAVGSVAAGLALGYLALKGRSLWPGVFLHVTVAFCADFFSLIHSGRLSILLR